MDLMELNSDQLIETLSKKQILKTIPSGLFLVDIKRNVVHWNSEAERITGYKSSEIVGQHCSILKGIECGQGCGLYDTGTPEKPVIGVECEIYTKAGEKVFICKNIDFLWLKGEVVGGIETFIDITQQKELESSLRHHSEKLEKIVDQRTAALKDERFRLHALLDGMNDMAYIVSADLRIIYFNKAMEKVFGANPERRCYEVIHGRKAPCEDCPWGRITTGAVVEEREFGPYDSIYEIIHSPVYGPRGELQKLAVCRDITAHKKALNKLLTLNKQLDSFAHTVSHDLRSPLIGIGGYTGLIKEQYGKVLKDDGLQMLDEVENQARRMSNIIEDMLSFSTVDHAQLTGRPVSCDEVVNQVLLDNRFEIEDKKIHVTTHDLPLLKIPETLLYELMCNLLLNAIRYGCEKEGEVEVFGETTCQQYSINVVDHGPGVPEDERETVFGAFVRGSGSGHVQGTGIGLATVKKIVKRFDGSVQLLETLGGGCTVRVQIPQR